MDDDLNIARHMENVTPMLRTVLGPQRSPTLGELVAGSGRWTRNGKHLLGVIKPTTTMEDMTNGV